jgi:hypothetical protein
MAQEGKEWMIPVGIIGGLVVMVALAYVGLAMVIILDFVASSFTWLGIEGPIGCWLVLGLVTGAFAGLAMGFKRAQRSPGWPVYGGAAGMGALVFLGAFNANPVRTVPNSQPNTFRAPPAPACSQSNVYSMLGKHNWKTQVNNKLGELQIYSKNGKWFGRITYSQVREELTLEVNSDCSFVLRGTRFRRLSGSGTFALDTFSGRLSSDSRSITGTFVDAANNRGQWLATAK